MITVSESDKELICIVPDFDEIAVGKIINNVMVTVKW